MRKQKLLELPVMATTKAIEIALHNDKEIDINQGYGYQVIKAHEYYWFYRAKVQIVDTVKVLQVSVFTRYDMERKITEPRYRIFLFENKYLTYDTQNSKWKTAKINNLEYPRCIGFGVPVNQYTEEKDRKTIIGFAKNEYQQPYAAISYWQDENKHMKELDKIDHDMNLVPALPRNFDKWIMETAMIESRYIYYEYSKHVTEGYCTHCKQEVAIENPKYNKEGTCQNCKSKITFKTKKKQGYSTEDRGYATLIQKTKEGYVTRYFEIRMDFSDYKKITGEYWETIRTVYANDFRTNQEYEWARFKGTQIMRWCNKNTGRWNDINIEYRSVVYEKNLDKIFAGSGIQYAAYDRFVKSELGYKHYPHHFIDVARRKPCIEFMVKTKLYEMTKEVMAGRQSNYMDTNKKTIKEVFNLPKEKMNQLVRVSGNMRTHEILKEAEEFNIRLEDEHLIFLSKNDRRRNMCVYIRHTTQHKMIKYLKKQGEVFNCADYHDYLQVAAQLGYDLKNEFVLFPKNFVQEHDAVMLEKAERDAANRRKKETKENRIIKKLAKKYAEQYYMEDKNFLIRPVNTATELRQEGHALHHCVAQYKEKVAAGKCIILLIRKKNEPEKPFYTMEVGKNEIVQVRGKNNCGTTKEVQAFVNKFAQQKLTEKQERKVS